MDKEPEDLQFLSTWGILKESFAFLRPYARLFTSLTLSLVVPLCFMLLAHNLVTEPLIYKIKLNQYIATHRQGTPAAQESQKELMGEWLKLSLFFLIYLLFVFAFSLLSTAAMVYSVACIYTHRPLTYSSVISVVPRVWKRLMFTFLWAFLLLTAYQIAAVLSIKLVIFVFRGTHYAVLFFFLVFTVAFFCIMLVYLTCIWHLASVISVLEEKYGLGALRKSVYLIKGKRRMAYRLFCIYLVCTFTIAVFFRLKVVHGSFTSVDRAIRLFYGIVLVLLLSFVSLMGMLVQTVYYFACKSYHHEGIDWVALSEHLGAYLGEYVPLKGSIQMETLEP